MNKINYAFSFNYIFVTLIIKSSNQQEQ